MSGLTGYVSARLYKMHNGSDWTTQILLAAYLVPLMVACCIGTVDFIDWLERSSAKIPFTQSTSVAIIWVGLSTPATIIGAWLGYI
jgi:transmembrane 9 superfamily member 2/4